MNDDDGWVPGSLGLFANTLTTNGEVYIKLCTDHPDGPFADDIDQMRKIDGTGKWQFLGSPTEPVTLHFDPGEYTNLDWTWTLDHKTSSVARSGDDL